MSESLSSEPVPKRRRLTGKRLIGIALAALVVLRVGVELIPTRVRIGPETTVIDSPLREDGTIDYAAALNDEWAAGVTPDQNAAVDLLRAFGPGIIDESIREAYFARLGIPVPQLEGAYLVDFRDFLEARGVNWQEDASQFEELEKQQASAMERPWSSEEFPEVAQWLDANQTTLELVRAATERPRYFSPLIPPEDSPLMNAWMPTEQASRDAARLQLAQAMRELADGHVERAFDLTLAAHRLARLISEHPTMIGAMISIALDSIAAQGDAAIVLHGNLTVEQAVADRQRLHDLPPARTIADVIDRGERFMALDMTLALSSGRVAEVDAPAELIRWGFDPNPALRRFNEAYDGAVAAVSVADPIERQRAIQRLANAIDEKAELGQSRRWAKLLIHTRSAVSEYVADILVAFMMPVIEPAANAEERRNTHLHLADIGYALAAHRADSGEFPESLDNLVPNSLEAVPLDRYTGAPLKYRRTDGGFLLYSVGENGIDDGGIMGHPQDDIAFGDLPDHGE